MMDRSCSLWVTGRDRQSSQGRSSQEVSGWECSSAGLMREEDPGSHIQRPWCEQGGPGEASGPREGGPHEDPQCFPIPEPRDLEELGEQAHLRELSLTGKEC